MVSLRRDRVSLVLSFVVPIAFFSMFAIIFGSQHDTVGRVRIIVVDQDQSRGSQQLVKGLQNEGSLVVSLKPEATKSQPQLPDYTAETAEAAVKAGDISVALIVPHGFGEHPVAFGGGQGREPIQLLYDGSDKIAPQMVGGLLQKVAMTSMPATMAEEGMKYSEQYIGGYTPEQQKKMKEGLQRMQDRLSQSDAGGAANPAAKSASGDGGIIAVQNRSVVGENKKNPMMSFEAAAVGVMFLLFTASASAGALLDEAESGALDRVLGSRVGMSGLMTGKLIFNILLAFSQLTLMFLWGWAVFKVELFSHIPGFVVMGLSTSFAVAAFGMLLASVCRTRGQLGALSTLLILVMSAIGGSMFPRFLMPEAMQKAGLFTINGWALDGFIKVFWRDMPVSALWQQVSVLLAIGIVLFALARRIARRWEYA
jgi:ABC-2 type transport system permease protein